MRKRLFHSFRTRLFAGFLIVSLIPLLICSSMLLQIFRLQLTSRAEEEAREYLDGLSHTMDSIYAGFCRAVSTLQGNPLVTGALTGDGGEDTEVHKILFSATEDSRLYAGFDLYDNEGNRRYSTQGASGQKQLSTHWGILYAAHGNELTFAACEDVSDTSLPLLQGAVPLYDQAGQQAGYLVIDLYYSGFRQIQEGKYGLRNDLIVLNQYWRPVYCEQPSLAAVLAPELRGRLLSGEQLDVTAEDFLYWVEYHEPMGLYLILRQPQVFTRDSTRLLYTVSLTCALVCVAISVLMSLKLSRQMFQPIQQLHQCISDVAHNNLDVHVPPGRDDELGELAVRFNGMVSALKYNQEELVKNQRELDETQIRMLQAQLNPHFLCNTLDTMKWISKINKVPQVALMSTNLADVLRFCISPEEFVPLRREVEVLERYIEIQKIRLSGTFTFSVEMPPELGECLTPKMILQPIVENAILHGLDGMEDGAVWVKIHQAGQELLHITVTDNGPGFPPEMAGKRYSCGKAAARGRLGLYNVDTILAKYYGADCGLYLDNGPNGRGAVVTAVLPIRQKEGTEC